MVTEQIPLSRLSKTPLMLYVYSIDTTTKDNKPLRVTETVMSYQYEVAIGVVFSKYENIRPEEIKFITMIDVSKIIKPLKNEIQKMEKKEKVAENRVSKNLKIQNFIYNLQFARDKFKKKLTTADLKSLDKIINKLNKKNGIKKKTIQSRNKGNV